mgnify:CR=1 FL=1
MLGRILERGGRLRPVEHERRHADLAQPLLGLVQEVLDDALARLVVNDEVGDVVALRRGVLGVEARVEVEPRAVLEEYVGVAGAGDDLLEEVARDVVGRQAALAVERARQAVFVLEAEDARLHDEERSVRSSEEGIRLKVRPCRPRSSTATSSPSGAS